MTPGLAAWRRLVVSVRPTDSVVRWSLLPFGWLHSRALAFRTTSIRWRFLALFNLSYIPLVSRYFTKAQVRFRSVSKGRARRSLLK
jgi:hypothetical protein